MIKFMGYLLTADEANALNAYLKIIREEKKHENVKTKILNILSDEGKQCKDIAKTVGITSQKCASLLRQMVEAGLAEKHTTEKKTTYFKCT